MGKVNTAAAQTYPLDMVNAACLVNRARDYSDIDLVESGQQNQVAE